MGFLNDISNKINKFLMHLCTIIMFLAVFIILLQVFARFFGLSGMFRWAWESIIIFNLWLTYLGATILFKENKHISLTSIFEKRASKFSYLFNNLIIIITSILVIKHSTSLSIGQFNTRMVTIPFLTRGHVSMIIPISFVVIAFYKIINIFEFFKNKRG